MLSQARKPVADLLRRAGPNWKPARLFFALGCPAHAPDILSGGGADRLGFARTGNVEEPASAA